MCVALANGIWTVTDCVRVANLQILNQLSIWRVSDASLTYDDVKVWSMVIFSEALNAGICVLSIRNVAQAKLKNARKDTNGSLGPFEVVRQVWCSLALLRSRAAIPTHVTFCLALDRSTRITSTTR